MIDNPAWERVKDFVKTGTRVVDDAEIRTILGDNATEWDRIGDAWDAAETFTIPSPDVLEFVAKHVGPAGLVDPLAGNGYWGYVLPQYGIDVACYDYAPPPLRFTSVAHLSPVEAVRRHAERTLLLAWGNRETDTVGFRALAIEYRRYGGQRIIYLGECAEDSPDPNAPHLSEFRDNWMPVDTHIPVRWPATYDLVTVFDVKGHRSPGTDRRD